MYFLKYIVYLCAWWVYGYSAYLHIYIFIKLLVCKMSYKVKNARIKADIKCISNEELSCQIFLAGATCFDI